MITFKVKGLEATLSKVRAFPKQFEKKADAILANNVREMDRNAKRDAPTDQGLLRNEITTKKIASLHWAVISQAAYSGYVEFGTKSKVSIPAGLGEIAAEVRSEKFVSTLDAKTAIFQWCKRSGIEERLWYPIFISIMVKGRRAHPFFFKQGDRQEPILINDLRQLVNEQHL
jgi:hypothetical protein